MVYEPTTNFKDSNGVDLGKKLITQDYVATVYPSLTQSAAGFIASPAELYLWGQNGAGTLGDGTNAARSTPRQEFTASTNWQQISCGQVHTTAIKTDGTLWSWGANNVIQLGDNSIISRSTPRQISAGATGVTGWKQIDSAPGYHNLALRNDGSLWSWGYNLRGQLGDNTNEARSTPRQISAGATRITGWKQVSAGYSHSAAIWSDGTLWLWGQNTSGQLGDNTNAARSTPIQEFTSSNNWKMVACGEVHTTAIKNDGTMWLWGANNYGQLGNNTSISRSTPIQEFTSSNNWKQVSAVNCTLAIKTNGTLWSWGLQSTLQLGITIPIFARSTPGQEFTSSTNWKHVAVGANHTAALKTDGTLWLWGSNAYGRLGNNTTQVRSTPIQEFTSGTNWRQVSAGNFTAAIKFPIGR